jgi:fumarylacetoacetate (FAA) hydrolase
MKLATYRDGTRDGKLVLVSRDLKIAAFVGDIAQTLQYALDHWEDVQGSLRLRSDLLNGQAIAGAFPFRIDMCMAPLPRAYQWADGSAYLNHVALVRKARGAEMPPELFKDPLMYQGGSDTFLGALENIPCADEAFGVDFEAEVAVVTGDIAMGTSPDNALAAVRLVMIVNDVSLRNLIPQELAKGFGFLQSKPSSAFSPVAVTPDELGDAWTEGRLHLPMHVSRNEEIVGRLQCGEDMNFSFGQLIAHLCKTRSIGAGTIVGSGTVSNKSPESGYACIAEKRMLETIESGKPVTHYLRPGETVRIEVTDGAGASVFGAIHQAVVGVGS